MKICDRCGQNTGVTVVRVEDMPYEFSDEVYDLCEKCRLDLKKFVRKS